MTAGIAYVGRPPEENPVGVDLVRVLSVAVDESGISFRFLFFFFVNY